MSAIKQKKIGLALGSGGTRGFAHIGVLKVLISENIPVDFLVGSSAGAVIAAYFAVHGEIESFENLVVKMKKIDFVSLIDFISPKKALIRGTKIQKFIDKLFMYKDKRKHSPGSFGKWNFTGRFPPCKSWKRITC